MGLFNILNLNISFETYIFIMFDVVFSVKAEVIPNETIKVVGCLTELGAWSPHLAPALVFKKGRWEGAKLKVQPQRKFEFKVIKVKQDGTVQWEELPNNSNRKFKPKCHSKLHLVWNSPEGKITTLTRNSIKLNGHPEVTRIESRAVSSKPVKKSNEQFDPYRSAYDDGESDSDKQQQFSFIKRKISDEIVVSSTDLQQIYYNSCPIQIYWDLLKKLKFYVISSQVEISDSFLELIESQLKQLPSNCMVKWITSDCLLSKQKHRSNFRTIKKRNSMFEIRQEQLNIQSLYSRTSYFMFLQLETAIKFKGKVGNNPACLFLPSSKYQETIDLLPYMSHIQLICFDQPATNRTYLEYLRGNEGFSSGGENQRNLKISVSNPSVCQIIQALKELRYRDAVIINTLGSIAEHEGLKLIEHENTVTIIDSHVSERYPNFTQKVIQKLHNFSLLVIVCENDPSQQILAYRQQRNVAIVYNSYEKIILQGKFYHPMRNCRQVIELLMMKVKLHQQNHGGEINEKFNFLTYNLPEGKHEVALRIQNELKGVVSRYSFIKVALKGLRIKITWNLAIQARILRTICEIKYLNFGVLGNFNIVSDRLSLRELKDALRLLIQHCPKLFLAKQDTKVRYFSYGDGQAATCHILPEPTEQEAKTIVAP